MQHNPNDFGREVMKILEERLGYADLETALKAPIEVKGNQELVKVENRSDRRAIFTPTS